MRQAVDSAKAMMRNPATIFGWRPAAWQPASNADR